eukprot:5714885-Prymnesium_polylepis.3
MRKNSKALVEMKYLENCIRVNQEQQDSIHSSAAREDLQTKEDDLKEKEQYLAIAQETGSGDEKARNAQEAVRVAMEAVKVAKAAVASEKRANLASEDIFTRQGSFQHTAPLLEALEKERAKLEILFERKCLALPDYVLKLVGGFEYRVYWYELVECARKLMLVGAPVFFDPPGSVQQLIYGLIACFLAFGANSWFQPYKNDVDDRLASMCQFVIFFSLLASIIDAFDEGTLRDNYNIQALLIIATIVPAATTLFMELEVPDEGKQWLASATKRFKFLHYLACSRLMKISLPPRIQSLRLLLEGQHQHEARPFDRIQASSTMPDATVQPGTRRHLQPGSIVSRKVAATTATCI